jgi:hypothetical protein
MTGSAKQSMAAAKLDCFVASAPLRKRFAFVAGNDVERVPIRISNSRRAGIRSINVIASEAKQSTLSFRRTNGLRSLLLTLPLQGPPGEGEGCYAPSLLLRFLK